MYIEAAWHHIHDELVLTVSLDSYSYSEPAIHYYGHRASHMWPTSSLAMPLHTNSHIESRLPDRRVEDDMSGTLNSTTGAAGRRAIVTWADGRWR